MKKTLIIAAALCLLAVGVTQAQTPTEKLVGTLGVGINGGLMLPMGGDVGVDESFSDAFGIGPKFGAHVNYGIIPELTARAGFSYTFMKVDDDYNDGEVLEPYFTAPYVYVDAVFNLGSFFKAEDNMLNPYLLGGGGMYFWKVTDDGAGGDAILLENNEELSKTSFGLNFGAGLEVYATPDLSIFAEGKYHMIFAEDTDTFGDYPENLGATDVSVGLTYHFPIGGN